MNYQIKVTGSGSKIEILGALTNLIASIYNEVSPKSPEHTFEDETLCTEIQEKDFDEMPEFNHIQLSADFTDNTLDKDHFYTLDNIGRIQIEPEQWELIFRRGSNEEVNEEIFEYLYDNESEAQADWDHLKELTAVKQHN